MQAIITATGELSGQETDGVERGDAAFDELFEAHQRPAYRLAMLLSGGETALAEDAVSEAFVRVLPRWRAGTVDDFGAYLRRAVVNEVNRTFRRRMVLRRALVRVDDGGRSGTRFDDEVAWHHDLQAALRMLPLRQRTAVVLHYHGGLALDEVAAAMSTSVGTAKAHLSRGRNRLRELLEGQS